MARSRKDGRRGGGHRNTQNREYWQSRWHRHGETIGRVIKTLTHRWERRVLKRRLEREALDNPMEEEECRDMTCRGRWNHGARG